MNVVVRRDMRQFHVLGGGDGNETTHFEFERGIQVDPGYHVYQVCAFAAVIVSQLQIDFWHFLW
jgi:hypothetical protein